MRTRLRPALAGVHRPQARLEAATRACSLRTPWVLVQEPPKSRLRPEDSWTSSREVVGARPGLATLLMSAVVQCRILLT